jgi:hypothetical protein
LLRTGCERPDCCCAAQQSDELAPSHSLPVCAVKKGLGRKEAWQPAGLMSYGPNLYDAYRLVGVYTGKILNGASPADLPVEQTTKVDFVINQKTAKILGLTYPLPLLGLADEMIE